MLQNRDITQLRPGRTWADLTPFSFGRPKTGETIKTCAVLLGAILAQKEKALPNLARAVQIIKLLLGLHAGFFQCLLQTAQTLIALLCCNERAVGPDYKVSGKYVDLICAGHQIIARQHHREVMRMFF